MAAAEIDEVSESALKRSPFVGPQPYTHGQHDRFFGRNHEVAELLAMIGGRRAVLLHAESGAGKTSLLNAGLRQEAPEDEFLILPSARVINRPAVPTPTANGVQSAREFSADPGNVFVRNYIEDLIAQLKSEYPEKTEALDAARVDSFVVAAQNIEEALLEANDHRTVVFVVDQFEELFTTNLGAWKQRKGFFKSAREMLFDKGGGDSDWPPQRRLLLSMRSDYVAQVERYARFLPERLNARYHLQRLTVDQAVEAITKPFALAGISLEDAGPEDAGSEDPGPAQYLAERLSEENVQGPDGRTERVSGEFVEPVQLQVVCDRMYQNLPIGTREITTDIARHFADVDQALKDYYDEAVSGTAKKTGVSEREIRDWFSKQLIVSNRFRAPAHVDAKLRTVAGLKCRKALEVVDLLQGEFHVVRSESRAGARWVEIAHDRFVDPIQVSNRAAALKASDRKTRWLTGIAASGVALIVAIAAWYAYLDRKVLEAERETAERIARLDNVLAQALNGSEPLHVRAVAAIEALKTAGGEGRSIEAGYQVLGELDQVEAFLDSPFAERGGSSTLFVDPSGGLLFASYDREDWRVRPVRTHGQDIPDGVIDGAFAGQIAADDTVLASSRSGSTLAVLTRDRSFVVYRAPGESPQKVLDLPARWRPRAALDGTGRYLSVLMCPAWIDAAEGRCPGTVKLQVHDLDNPSAPVFETTLPDGWLINLTAVDWSGEASRPWIAVAGCRIAPGLEAARSTGERGSGQTDLSGGGQQESTAGQRAVCDEHLVAVRPPTRLGGGEPQAKEQTAKQEVDEDQVPDWITAEVDDPAATLIFASTTAVPAERLERDTRSGDQDLSSGSYKTLYFETRSAGGSADRWVALRSMQIRRSREEPDSWVTLSRTGARVLSSPRPMRGLVDLGDGRFAWLSPDSSIVLAKTLPFNRLVSPLMANALSDSMGGGSRPVFLPQSGAFVASFGTELTLVRRTEIAPFRDGSTAAAQSGSGVSGEELDWRNLSVSADGRFVASYPFGKRFREIVLFDMETGDRALLHRAETGLVAEGAVHGLAAKADLAAFAFLPDGRQAVLVEADGSFHLAKLNDGPQFEIEKSWSISAIGQRYDYPFADLYDFQVLPEGRFGIVVGDLGGFLVDLRDGGSRPIPVIENETLIGIALSEEYDVVALVGVDGSAFTLALSDLLAVATGEMASVPVNRIRAGRVSADIYSGVAIARDGKRLYAADLFTNAIDVFEIATGRFLARIRIPDFENIAGLAIDPESDRALVTSFEDPQAMALVDLSMDGLAAALCRVTGGTTAGRDVCAESYPAVAE